MQGKDIKRKEKVNDWVVVIGAIAAIIFINPWTWLNIGILLLPNPPKPEITYGEFPFRLEYEINGERKVIEDTVICEYDGIGANEGNGKYIKWKEKLASGHEKIILMETADEKVIFYKHTGLAKYYMGGMNEDEYKNYKERLYEKGVAFYDKRKKYSERMLDEKELLEEYGIKIISWEPSEPIVNTFK